jgi:hypothetical protein
MNAAAGVDMTEIIEAAVRLGADWRSLESGRLKVGNTRLRLTAPDDPDDAALPAKAPHRNKRRAG